MKEKNPPIPVEPHQRDVNENDNRKSSSFNEKKASDINTDELTNTEGTEQGGARISTKRTITGSDNDGQVA